MFWSFGYQLLQTDTTLACSPTAWRREGKMVLKNLIKPPMLGTYVGLLVGLTPPLQAALFGAHPPLKFVASAADILAHASVPLMTFILGVSLGKSLNIHAALDWAKAWLARQRRTVIAAAATATGAGAGVGGGAGGTRSSRIGYGDDDDDDVTPLLPEVQAQARSPARAPAALSRAGAAASS